MKVPGLIFRSPTEVIDPAALTEYLGEKVVSPRPTDFSGFVFFLLPAQPITLLVRTYRGLGLDY